jgi:hypothetical protein
MTATSIDFPSRALPLRALLAIILIALSINIIISDSKYFAHWKDESETKFMNQVVPTKTHLRYETDLLESLYKDIHNRVDEVIVKAGELAASHQQGSVNTSTVDTMKTSHRTETEALNAKLEEKIRSLTTEHDAAMKQLKEKMEQEAKERMDKMQQHFASGMNTSKWQHEAQIGTNDLEQPKDTFMIVFTFSKPAGKEARDMQRDFCQPMYARHGVKHVFAVGKPSFDDRPHNQKIQGQLATEMEVNISKMLMQEHDQYGDLLLTPNRDHYRDMTEKLLSSIRYSLEQGADYILKTDDEYCINITEVKRLVEERKKNNNELYMGIYQFAGDEYESMKGADGTIAPFMSGWVIGLSRKLAKTIAEDGWNHNLLIAPYGTSSDDANLGKWVDWAIRTHNLTVDYTVSRDLNINVPGMQ